MSDEKHALVVKTHWQLARTRYRNQMEVAAANAAEEGGENKTAYLAGIYSFVAGAALDLLDEVLTAAKEAQGELPIDLLLGRHLIVDGKRYRVINDWVDTDAGDGRKRWGIVTEEPAE